MVGKREINGDGVQMQTLGSKRWGQALSFDPSSFARHDVSPNDLAEEGKRQGLKGSYVFHPYQETCDGRAI